MTTRVTRLRGRKADIIENEIFRLGQLFGMLQEDLRQTALNGPDGVRQTAVIGITANEIKTIQHELEMTLEGKE